jgi:hypothetical protein
MAFWRIIESIVHGLLVMIAILWVASIPLAYASCPFIPYLKECRGDAVMAWAMPFFGSFIGVPALTFVLIARAKRKRMISHASAERPVRNRPLNPSSIGSRRDFR